LHSVNRSNESAQPSNRLRKELGISFQQVQKYEEGVNRVSASRLFEVCRVLNVSLASMFEHDPKV
jgi:transcriptional regulator with XRE-family HTH domain